MAGERGAGHADGLGDLPGRHLPSRSCEQEEDLEPGEVGEGLERLGVAVARFEPLVGLYHYLLHISQYIEI